MTANGSRRARHVLYVPEDFTIDELVGRNNIAVLVIEGDLGICKNCGAGESELDDFTTCEAYREHMRKPR